MESYCVRAFAEALEAIPYTLAENAGLNPIEIMTDLRNRHANGDKSAGINVRRNTVSDMLKENVVQPLLVTTSAIDLATECVRMILKVTCTSSSSSAWNVSQYQTAMSLPWVGRCGFCIMRSAEGRTTTLKRFHLAKGDIGAC